jgi:3-hydroxy-3-methylglutaryl CoA synthase/uncharacterized OB-fold protein
MTRGIFDYGVYLPRFRLSRAAVAAVLGGPSDPGTRAVAGYDEDATSLGVEAARQALAGTSHAVDDVLLATATPPYLDKTNATTVRAALGLPSGGLAADMAGSSRSGYAAFRAGLTGDGVALVVLSDLRTGLPGGADEVEGGDGAAAFVVGRGADDEILAEYVGGASVSEEFLDRWRQPGQTASRTWEERFGEAAYLPLVERALGDALKNVGLTPADVDWAVVTGLHRRAVRSARLSSGFRQDAIVDDLSATIGNTGTAHLGIMLASALDCAEPGHVIATVLLADGVDVAFFQATPVLRRGTRARPVAGLVTEGGREVAYAAYLTWRGLLEREPARRPQPPAPVPPASLRQRRWKYAFAGSRCSVCGQRHLPPQRVCAKCGTADRMEQVPMSTARGTVTTLSTDHLAATPAPPAMSVVVDFDGGGRCHLELTDAEAGEVSVGDRVELTFRRLYTTDGVHNYFWKARPAREGF